MRQAGNPPVYEQVAFDIAAKIASGELKEGDRFFGRSLLSSQYGVSFETVRRTVGLLNDLGIVSIKNNIGSTVTSQNARSDCPAGCPQRGDQKDLWGNHGAMGALPVRRPVPDIRIYVSARQSCGGAIHCGTAVPPTDRRYHCSGAEGGPAPGYPRAPRRCWRPGIPWCWPVSRPISMRCFPCWGKSARRGRARRNEREHGQVGGRCRQHRNQILRNWRKDSGKLSRNFPQGVLY